MTRIKKTQSTDHLASDIWLLLCCAVAPHNKSQVKTIFRSKAASGGFIPDLIGEAIRGNGRALSHLFSSSALDLADGLVRSPEAEARGLGGFLYSEMFEEFHDPVQRQEVVGSLVTHVASGGSSDEIDSAMKVFSRLVEDDSTSAQSNGSTDVADATSSLRPFRPYLSSLLDYVRGMTSSQLRRLFMVLLMVGDDGDNDMDGPRKVGVGGCDDVQIVIRKYLAMPSAFLKRIVGRTSSLSKVFVLLHV
jgi:Fanconi anemia group D2 protein